MNNYQSTLNLIGRLLIVTLFLPAGLSKIMSFAGTVDYFGSLGIPAPLFALVATIVIEVIGSIALLIGYQTRMVALIMAFFTLMAAITGHAFWAAPADAAYIERLLFFKNIAVIGGLLVLASAGAGRFSIDAQKATK